MSNMDGDTNISKAQVESMMNELQELKKINAEMLTALIELRNENDFLKSRILEKPRVADLPRKIAKTHFVPLVPMNNEHFDDDEDNNNLLHAGTGDSTGNISNNSLQVEYRTNNGEGLINNNNQSYANVANGGCYNNVNANGTINKNKKKIIQVIDTDLKTVNEKIKFVKCNNYTLVQKSNKSPIKIAITSANEIPIIRESLVNANLSFHEYKWRDEKAKCFVIRGLTGASINDIPYIKQELIDAGLPNNIVVVQLQTGFMRANPGAHHNTLFKLIVPPDFDTKILLNIKHLDHVAVSFEKLKGNRIMQCKNCQRFGHSAGGCQHPHRCVKCGQNHYRDDCPRTNNKASKLRCCNCGGEHTANNRTQCQYFQQNFAKTNSTSINRDESPAILKSSSNSNKSSNSHSVVSGLSFAQVASSRPGSSKPQNSKNHVSSNVTASLVSKLDLLIDLFTRHLNKHG